jgi:hypothetical protein
LIKKAKVEKDKNGEWIHPDLPDWGESVEKKVLRDWENENLVNLYYLYFEIDAPERLVDDYFENNKKNLHLWNPQCNISQSFLLSIFEGEDGPVAIYAIERKERLYAERINNF